MRESDPIETHFKLSGTHASALRKLGMRTIRDILYHFPTRYESAGSNGHASNLVPATKVTLFGTLSNLKAKKMWRSRRPATEGWFEDSTGRVKVMWFNQPYIASYVPQESAVKLTGTVGGTAARPYIANPEVEAVPSGVVPDGLFDPSSAKAGALSIFPVYPETRGITSRWFFHAIAKILSHGVHAHLADPIPKSVCASYKLPDLATSIVYIHTPEKTSHAEAARKRFAFEEILTLQVMRAHERTLNESQPSFHISNAEEQVKKFVSSISVVPTGAQHRAIHDIVSDFGKMHPMARLLEGDVGAGKTLVAAATSYAAVTSRPPNRNSGTLQVAYMAPTEILAQQHFQSFISYFSHLPINIALMTGSGCKKFPSKLSKGEATTISRSQLLKWVANGEIAMLVGTHALIQKSVTFQHLAFVIVDEQHRFGTKQRRALAHKGDAAPHFLSMTATPIPRTLALTMYGDLDISILDELPPGRAKITTKIVSSGKRNDAYEAVREELKKGRQAYVICPRIEEPDPAKIHALQAKSAKAEAKRLQKDIFSEYAVGLLHGSMKPSDKDTVMRSFEAGEIDVLVATSVVEVGVNVPNATVILIEGAERFGLAQLHQLRGRVMRSSHPPLCFLLPETKGDVSMRRLKALETSDNGFVLAEADLEARGAGDLLGRKQWGVTDIGMDALKNVKLIRAARDEAARIISSDPTLKHNQELKRRVEQNADAHHGE